MNRKTPITLASWICFATLIAFLVCVMLSSVSSLMSFTTQEPDSWEAEIIQMGQEELQDIADEAEGKHLSISRWAEERERQIRQNINERIRARKAEQAIEKAEAYLCKSHDRIPSTTKVAVQAWCATKEIPEVCSYEKEVFDWLQENAGAECER